MRLRLVASCVQLALILTLWARDLAYCVPKALSHQLVAPPPARPVLLGIMLQVRETQFAYPVPEVQANLSPGLEDVLLALRAPLPSPLLQVGRSHARSAARAITRAVEQQHVLPVLLAFTIPKMVRVGV